METQVLAFEEVPILFSKMIDLSICPSVMWENLKVILTESRKNFPTSSTTTVISLLCDLCWYLWCEKISNGCFDLPLSDKWCSPYFHIHGHLCFLWGKFLFIFHILPFLIRVECFLTVRWYQCSSSLYIFDINSIQDNWYTSTLDDSACPEYCVWNFWNIGLLEQKYNKHWLKI